MGLKRVFSFKSKILILVFLFMIVAIAIGINNKETDKVETMGTITVQEGDQLMRDIIPEILSVFNIDKQDVLKLLSSPGESLLLPTDLADWRKMEGLISPGSYKIPQGRTLKEQLVIWLNDSEKRLQQMKNNITDYNNLTDREYLVLASIIEAECLDGNYHDKISEVFLNRIQGGSKLQSCVTVEYALGYQRPYLLFADIEINSPYNTYLNKGLPPGPICAISTDSLRAAMKKQPSSQLRYFFFDYVLSEMFFFEDYKLFKKEGSESGERFKSEQSLGRHDKINKQIIYKK